jgi:hypothetical protein
MMGLADHERRMRDGRYRCPYCLGWWVVEGSRSDRLYCGKGCREAARVALAAASAADLPLVGTRTSQACRERRKATGYATVAPMDSHMADLRVRLFELGELVGPRQLIAAVQWGESLEAVAAASGLPLHRLVQLDIDVAAAVREVAWV